MPGPANPAMQGAAQKGGRHIGKSKKWLYVTTQQERIMLNISYLIIGIIFRAVPEK